MILPTDLFWFWCKCKLRQVWKAIHYYENLISEKPTILIGDLNSNTVWDRKSRLGNHSYLVHRLAAKNIKSVYHHFFSQLHRKEFHPTLFLYRHRNKQYHLDYCFASADHVIKDVKVGPFEDWAKHSDHVPVFVCFENV